MCLIQISKKKLIHTIYNESRYFTKGNSTEN